MDAGIINASTIFIIDFINTGETYASIPAEIAKNKKAMINKNVYRANNGKIGSPILLINCCLIILKENATDSVAEIIKIGITIIFCGKTDTNDNKNPCHPIWFTKKPTVNPTTIPLINNRINITGNPIIDIPNSHIKPINLLLWEKL